MSSILETRQASTLDIWLSGIQTTRGTIIAKRVTKRQQAVLEAIRSWIKERGYPPTLRELGRQLGIKSLRGVTSHLDAIAKKGLLKRDSRARSISLVGPALAGAQGLRIPVVGHIRAGEPLLAQEQLEGHLVVDEERLGQAGSHPAEHFALKVRGESMIGAGILEGDYVIVRQQPAAEPGDIVVALLEDEATVKRFFQEGDTIRLKPEHPHMEPIVLRPPQTLTILGKVVAVFRELS